jgi:hypothetical protein
MKTYSPHATVPGSQVENALFRAVRAWDQFWFRPSDPTTLGFIRICAGLIVMYVQLAYSFGLMDYVGPHAWVDTKALHYLSHEGEVYTVPWGWTAEQEVHSRGQYIWSLYFGVTERRWVYVVHFSLLAAMFLFTIGLWTRVTSALTWIAGMCYLQRAPTTLFGMDTMTNILLFYLMVGPSGAALSMDRWLKLRRQGWTGGEAPPPEPLASATFATRLLQIHFCFVYGASGLSKLLGSTWWNGTALWGTVANYSFAPMNLPWYYDSLVWLSQHRWAWELAMTGGVIFTLFLEISVPYLIWVPRLRWLMIIGAVLLHTGIGLSMGLVTFSLAMITMVFSFVPPEAVHYLLERLGDTARGVFGPPAPRADIKNAARVLEPAHARM